MPEFLRNWIVNTVVFTVYYWCQFLSFFRVGYITVKYNVLFVLKVMPRLIEHAFDYGCFRCASSNTFQDLCTVGDKILGDFDKTFAEEHNVILR